MLLCDKRGNTLFELAGLNAVAKLVLVRLNAADKALRVKLARLTLWWKRCDDALVRAKLLALDKGRYLVLRNGGLTKSPTDYAICVFRRTFVLTCCDFVRYWCLVGVPVGWYSDLL